METDISRKITMTPINLVTEKLPINSKTMKARQDYIREQPNFENGKSKWDDCANNTTEIYDYFAFVRQLEDYVEVFQVVNILPAIERPDYWDIPEHQARNVIYLSPILYVMSWQDLKNSLGYNETFKLQGTLKSKKEIYLPV
jgi:hypothetical protein